MISDILLSLRKLKEKEFSYIKNNGIQGVVCKKETELFDFIVIKSMLIMRKLTFKSFFGFVLITNETVVRS